MTKIHFLVYLIVSYPSVHAQNIITAILVNRESKQPIPYANVYVTENHSAIYLGSVTDITGRFEIKIPPTRQTDSLTISCIGFEKLKIPFRSLTQDSIFMQESTTHLAPIVVSDLSAEDYVIKCINRIPQNYRNALFINRGFNWQSFQKDSVYEKLANSFVTIEYENLTRSTKRKVKYDSTLTFSTKDFNSIIPTYDSLSEHIYFDLIRTGPGVLNRAQLNEWVFSFIYDEGESQNDVMIIEAKSRGKLVNNFKLYIDTNDWAFRKIEYTYRWPPGDNPLLLTRNSMIKNTIDTVHYALHTIQGVILYEKTKYKYNLKYLFNEIKYTQYTKGLEITSPIKSFPCCLRNELVISYSKEYRPGDSQFQTDRKALRPDFEPVIIHCGFYEAMKKLRQ